MMYKGVGTRPKPKAADCLLIGDSLTNYYYTNWNSLYTGTWQIDAYGIPGGKIATLMAAINNRDVIIDNYKTIIILLGINDLAQGWVDGKPEAQVVSETEVYMDQFIDLVKTRDTYVISCLPLDNAIKPQPPNSQVQSLNSFYLSKGNFINCYDALATGPGGANPHVYTDGIHLLQSGYDIIEPIIYSHIDFT